MAKKKSREKGEEEVDPKASSAEEADSTSGDNLDPQKEEESAEEKLREERDLWKDKYMRLAAEFDNYKKRQNRVFDEMVAASRDALILKILDVLDNFERAIESSGDPPDADAVMDGIHLIHKQFQDMLASENIEIICPEGECFDPQEHEAVSALPGDVPEETVTEVIQKGYRREGKLIRPARVVVTTPTESGEE